MSTRDQATGWLGPAALARIAGTAAFVRSVAPYDLIEAVHFGYFASLTGFF